ncbi:MAG: hypothetical protein ACLU4J_13575 [Butyricimonas paravirosa]
MLKILEGLLVNLHGGADIMKETTTTDGYTAYGSTNLPYMHQILRQALVKESVLPDRKK